MTLARILVAALLVAVRVIPLQAADRRVEVSPGVNGYWLVPDGPWDGRAVLMLHGFADDADGAGDLGKHLAERLARNGIASLRINFRGEGDRQRTLIESTFVTRLEDTAAADSFLLRLKGVDARRIGVFGFSLGASTAIETGARRPQWFRSMALWSSPSGDHFALWEHDATAQQALREGVASEDVPGWKKITTRREFYESFRGINLDASLAKYPGALLTIRGSGDYLPHRDDEMLRIATGKPREAVMLGGADHVFNVFESGAWQPERVIAVTVEWFARTL